MRAVKAFPDRAYGSVYLSPALPDFSLQELNRCVRDGPMVMIGEIEADARCNIPQMDPIAEWAAANEVVILQHEWLNTLRRWAGGIYAVRCGRTRPAPPQAPDCLRPHGRKLGTGHSRHPRH